MPEPDDPPASATVDELSDPKADAIISISPIEASSAADPNVIPPHLVGVDEPDEAPSDAADVEGDGTVADKGKKIWDWFSGKFDDLKTWAGDLVDSLGNNNEEAG